MKKILLPLLFISSFLNAEYLITMILTDKKEDYTFSRCIDSFFTSDSRLYYLKSADSNTYYKEFADIKDYKVESGFYLADNGACEKYTTSLNNSTLDNTLPLTSDTLTYLGLSDSDLNMMFGFSGILLSFLFLFGLFRWI